MSDGNRVDLLVVAMPVASRLVRKLPSIRPDRRKFWTPSKPIA